MVDQSQFLTKYRISNERFAQTGLEWAMLETIYNHHSSNTLKLLSTANLISDHLRQIEKVHSIRIRIKNPEHLIEKIIRKREEEPNRVIHLDNYQTEITDLIGVRSLHLFKEDWIHLHTAIMTNWDTHETPIAYIRRGDPESLFEESGCKVAEHKAGYRSVHYLIKCQPTKNLLIAEIQVRTIFEEGWSEIDHLLRYPHDVDNPILAGYLALFNRVAGNADEMGSYIRYLKTELEAREQTYKTELESHRREKEKMIKNLEEIKKKLKNETEERKNLQEIIDSMKKDKLPSLDTDWTLPGDVRIINSPRFDALLGLNQQAIYFSTCKYCSSLFSSYGDGTPTCPRCGKVQN